MSEQILNQIVEKLNHMDEGQRQIRQAITRIVDEQQHIKQTVNRLEEEQRQIRQAITCIVDEQQHIKQVIADIPLIRQAVLETRDDVKRLENALYKLAAAQNDHGYSIDILHREQLRIKTDIEKIKNR